MKYITHTYITPAICRRPDCVDPDQRTRIHTNTHTYIHTSNTPHIHTSHLQYSGGLDASRGASIMIYIHSYTRTHIYTHIHIWKTSHMHTSHLDASRGASILMCLLLTTRLLLFFYPQRQHPILLLLLIWGEGGMSHVTHRMSHVPRVNESCHTCEWFMSHVHQYSTWSSSPRYLGRGGGGFLSAIKTSRGFSKRMSHVAHVHESCHTCEYVLLNGVMSQIKMSHVTHMAAISYSFLLFPFGVSKVFNQ